MKTKTENLFNDISLEVIMLDEYSPLPDQNYRGSFFIIKQSLNPTL